MGKRIMYPSEFVGKVIAAMPDDPEIEGLLRSGSGFAVLNRLTKSGQNALINEWHEVFDGQREDSLLASFFAM